MSQIKVLIVEDESITALSLSHILISKGYLVSGLAESGKEALDSVRRNTPDVVLMDIYLDGGLDGIETSRLILKERRLPIIFLTALADDDTLSDAMLTNPYGYVLKPFSPGTVHIALQVALKRYEQDRELEASKKLLLDYARRIETVREEEGSRLSRDIHDVLGQKLTALRLNVAWLKKRLRDQSPELDERLEATNDLLGETMETVRDIAGAFRPTTVLERGLFQAMRREAELFSVRSEVPSRVLLPPEEPEIDKTQALMLFRIFQEALSNIARHARPREVIIRIERRGSETTLLVEDDGVGIPERKLLSPASLGLLGMRERATALNGSITLTPRPGGGTVVKVVMPERRGDA